MKRGKVLACVMVVAMAISTFSPINAKAQTVKNEGIEVNLGEFNIFIPDYTKDAVNIQTNEDTTNGTSVNIIDKKTGVVLETITSSIIPKNSPELNSIMAQDSIETLSTADTTYYAIQRDKSDMLVTVRLETIVVLYKSGSFSCVESIAGCNMFPISSSIATLESVSTYARSVSGSFPSTNIEYYGSGVITIVTTISHGSELNIGFSIADVIDLGYSVTTTISGNVYLRKPITIQGNFYTY